MIFDETKTFVFSSNFNLRNKIEITKITIAKKWKILIIDFHLFLSTLCNKLDKFELTSSFVEYEQTFEMVKIKTFQIDWLKPKNFLPFEISKID